MITARYLELFVQASDGGMGLGPQAAAQCQRRFDDSVLFDSKTAAVPLPAGG